MWTKIDDGFFDHPKARAAGKDGRALFFSGLCWASGHRNGGRIATTDLPLVAAKAEVRGAPTARRLVDVGLWEPIDGGWLIHDFLDWNPSPERIDELRQKRAEAGRKGGQQSKPPKSNGEANGQAKSEASA